MSSSRNNRNTYESKLIAAFLNLTARNHVLIEPDEMGMAYWNMLNRSRNYGLCMFLGGMSSAIALALWKRRDPTVSRNGLFLIGVGGCMLSSVAMSTVMRTSMDHNLI